MPPFDEKIKAQKNPSTLNRHFPIKFLTATIIFTVVVLLWLAWSSYRSYDTAKAFSNLSAKANALKGEILRLDEVLTMSARMCAATGDLKWEKRYRDSEPLLDEVIKEAIRMAPQANIGKAAEQTDAANAALIEMEHGSFDLVHQGRKEDAQKVLFSAEYEKQKRIYAEGILTFTKLVVATVNNRYINPESRKANFNMSTIVVVLVVLIVGWFGILKMLRRWEGVLIENNQLLERQSRDLILLNQSLDKKVKERTDELKQTQSQLFQSEKLASIGQLAAGVAHEINNPVGFISNNMEILQEYFKNYTKIMQITHDLKKQVGDEDIGGAKSTAGELTKFEEEINLDYIMNDTNTLLEHSVRGLERVKKTVLDLRTFAREENAENMDPIKVEEIIDSILNIVQNELKFKAELAKEYGNTPLVKGNTQRLGQVFINLLVNAAQAMEERGKIFIKTYRQDKYVCIDISDTGKGIPEENLKKIFDPFFTTKPIGQGTGLGLSVSYAIIKKHGGDLLVKSELGKGTTFTVRIPVAGAENLAEKG